MLQHRNKVVWYEGMTLDPHHFQQWDRYVRGVIGGRLRATAPHDWGLTRLKIDRERLSNGEFVLAGCSGVMPDGLLFDMPERDDAPPPANVQDAFGATADRLGVYLAVPSERADGSNFTLQDGAARRETRFAARSIRIADENTGADERPVEIAAANYKILFDGEQQEAYTTLKVAEVTRQVGGAFALSPTFVPPSLYLDASEQLQTIVRRLVELLVAKSGELTARQRSVLAQRELSPGDMVAIGLLGSVNTFLPVLNHYRYEGRTHPEALYLTMASLVGQLSAYLPADGVQVRDIPAYDHGDPSLCFNRLDAMLRGLLGEARPRANYVQLPLTQQRENLFNAQVESGVLNGAQLFLVARSDQFGEHELISEVPQKLRVAAPSNIEAVLRSYTRALMIEHTHRLPSGLPVDQQANYFQLQKRGPFWDSICQDGGIAVFVPAELQSLQLQLVAVMN